MTLNTSVPAQLAAARKALEMPPLRIVSSRPVLLDQKQGGGANNYQRALSRMICPIGRFGARNIRAVYANWYQGPGNQVDVATIKVKGAIDITTPAIQNRKTLFDGARELTLEAGDYAVTELAPYDASAGEKLAVRSEVRVANSGEQWPVGGAVLLPASGENFIQNFNESTNNIYFTGGLDSAGSAASFSFSPIALIGEPVDYSVSHVAIIAYGDSIMAGTGDTADINVGSRGWPRSCATRNIPVLQQGRGSDQASNFALSWRQTMLWQYGTHFICNHGTNDLAAGRTVAQLQADLTRIWTTAKRYGLHVTQILITPRTNASNVPAAGFESGGKRDDMNAWIKSQVGNGILDMVIDPNPGLENPAALGTWLNIALTDGGGTSGGLHLTSAGYNTAFANFNQWLAVLG